ncbi:MAG: ABC transporter ATP-binding protein [Clostridia bacterium]|nr:ABC transporter ATP-binding protein [Clostridia bacterium]
MIVANEVTMKFHTPGKEPFVALDGLTCQIPRGCIYGMIGANGSGKSTFLRLLSGVYRPASGSILIDDMPIWDNPAAKSRIVFIPDDLYFLPQSSMKSMARMYRALYPNFNYDRFGKLTETFKLDATANLNTFSKGMRRQAAAILGLSAMPDYLFFDETFDGLDPVMRGLVKQVIYRDVIERNTTTIITSHSLHELEDTCDQLALLHRGGIIFQSDVQDLKTALFKVQTAFSSPFTKEKFEGLNILSYTQMGSVCTFIIRGDRAETEARIRAMSPLLLDILPLTLEEVFVYEMEALGYSFKDILM